MSQAKKLTLTVASGAVGQVDLYFKRL